MEETQTIHQDFVYCLVTSPNFDQDGLIFAAKQSGLYRSLDGGQTWDDAYLSLDLEAPLPTTFVEVVSNKESLIIFACVEGNVLRSTDRGNTWSFAKLSSPPPLITTMVTSPNFAQDGSLLAGTMQDGIFRSTSGGATWSGWNFGLYDPNINSLAISPAFSEDQSLFAGTQSGIFHSINAGRSWRDLNFPIDAAPVLSLGLRSNGTIYAGTEERGLFISQDDGTTWNKLATGSVEQIILGQKDEILIVKDGGIQFSENDGKSWEARTGFEAESTISSVAAPLGLNAKHPLLAGLSNGEILNI